VEDFATQWLPPCFVRCAERSEPLASRDLHACMLACVVKGKGGCVRDEENARDVLARRDREGLWRRIRMKTLNS
jgi:hypothetical protein